MSIVNVFIDIETIPGPNKPLPENIKAPGNYKNPDAIRAYQDGAVEDAWRGESLLSHKGRVLCVGFAVEDGDTEGTVLPESYYVEELAMNVFWQALMRYINKTDVVRWIGFNISTFDINWLRHRAAKYGLRDLSRLLPQDRYPKNIFDVRQWWQGADYRAAGTLNDVAGFFGLQGKNDGMDGSKVFDFWKAGRCKEVEMYCKRDVDIVREIYGIVR